MVFTKFSPDQVERDVLCLALHCAHEAGLSDNFLVNNYQLSHRKLRMIRDGMPIKARVAYIARLACAIDDKRRRLMLSGRIVEAQLLLQQLHAINMELLMHLANIK